MEFKDDAFEQLENRGFVFQTTHLEETKKLLKQGPITFYIGIDPTADDLHIGHFFGLQMARILQDCGHTPSRSESSFSVSSLPSVFTSLTRSASSRSNSSLCTHLSSSA